MSLPEVKQTEREKSVKWHCEHQQCEGCPAQYEECAEKASDEAKTAYLKSLVDENTEAKK